MLSVTNKILSLQKKITSSEPVSNPTSKKFSNLIKPDFSPLIIKENKFIPKTISPNKTTNNIEPEYPIKTFDINLSLSSKIIGKDLFGIKENKNCIKEKKDLEKYTIKNKIRNNNAENNFIIIKTLFEDKFDAIYQVKEKETNKIFGLKRISEYSNKNNFNIMKTTLEDIQKESEGWDLPKTFCMKLIDYWIEDMNDLNKNMYILTQFYTKGDVIAYLENLEKNNFVFTPEFYWDIIFEMIIGLLYIHSKGYIHFDIKPTNYLVDDDGFIILNDFDLSHKEEELSHLNDIKEGDAK